MHRVTLGHPLQALPTATRSFWPDLDSCDSSSLALSVDGCGVERGRRTCEPECIEPGSSRRLFHELDRLGSWSQAEAGLYIVKGKCGMRNWVGALSLQILHTAARSCLTQYWSHSLSAMSSTIMTHQLGFVSAG